MTNQEAMRVKTLLEKILDRKAQIAAMVEAGEKTASVAMTYAYMFERTALDALDLLGEIEWPDQEEKK